MYVKALHVLSPACSGLPFSSRGTSKHACSCIVHVRLWCSIMQPSVHMMHCVHDVLTLYAKHLNVVTSPLRLSLACPQGHSPFALAMPALVPSALDVRLHVPAFCLQAAGTGRHPFGGFLHLARCEAVLCGGAGTPQPTWQPKPSKTPAPQPTWTASPTETGTALCHAAATSCIMLVRNMLVVCHTDHLSATSVS